MEFQKSKFINRVAKVLTPYRKIGSKTLKDLNYRDMSKKGEIDITLSS